MTRPTPDDVARVMAECFGGAVAALDELISVRRQLAEAHDDATEAQLALENAMARLRKAQAAERNAQQTLDQAIRAEVDAWMTETRWRTPDAGTNEETSA
jgi:hypothetical protein